ncbi:ligand-gated channel [Vibrio splendidus]|uniref:TonB-dependent hemoglobin/transferrin/lactoferrin family receptor n=1 Tax=Vibrio splendidus TaxID=29497 RepID=UPI000C825022|nr:TonB-dependent hemoglobin/transferrin/lactoferrin family receptor [Vibrio splendidus]PMO05898.1 ligand-gated channel [Vibrio splendidus]
MKLSPLSAAVLSVLAANLVHAESEVYHFEEVIVTANKIEQPLSEVAGSVAVITGEDLERKGVTELYDAIKSEPGVSVSGGAGRPQNITIRGMTGNRILIVKDGIKSADGFGANDINDKVGRNSFDMSNLESIEVIKGASSSVYGSGAIGGVVVVRTKKPGDYLGDKDFYSDVSATYTGISNKYKGATNLAFRSGKFESLVNLSYWEGEETRNFDEDLYNRDIDGVGGGYTLNYWSSDALMLKGNVEYYKDNLSRKEGSSKIQKDGKWDTEDFDQQSYTETFSAYAGFEYLPANTWFEELDAKIYWRDMTNEDTTNRLMSRTNNNVSELRRTIDVRGFTDQLLGANADFISTLQHQNMSHTLSYGVNMETNLHERPSQSSVLDWNGVSLNADVPFAPARSYNFAAFIRDAIEIDHWTVTAGARFDLHQLKPESQSTINGYEVKEQSSSEFSPSLSVSYQLTESLNTYLSYNHGFRAPGYDKIYGYQNHDFVPITPFVIVPNMDLEAETSDSFELGSKFDNGQTQLYAAVFYQKFDNFIDVKQITFVPDSNTGNYYKQYQNVNGVETYGIEASIAHRLSDFWSVSTKVGYVDGEDEDGEKVRTLTPWEGNAEVTYDDNAFSAYAQVNWAQAMDNVPQCEDDLGIVTDCATTSGWASVDLGVSYSWNFGLDVSANVMNLFDKEYIRYQDVAGIANSNKIYSTEPGRYFTVNAKYAF